MNSCTDSVKAPSSVPGWLQFPQADQLVAECTDPVHDRFNHINCIVPHFDMLKSELIDMFQPPHQLVGPADDPRREREPRVEHIVMQHREGECVEGADGEIARVCLFSSRSSIS